jgi:crotonobetainyl-CoA:carnitine CoA-transferase CaiB-like acyl-CoA transferase
MGQPQYNHKYPKSKYTQTSPLANLYQSSDGDWIMMSIPDYVGKKDAIFDVISKPHLKTDERFQTFATCRQDGNMRIIVEELIDGFSKTKTEDIVKVLDGLDVVYEVLANPNDLYKDEQAWANGYLHELTMQSGNKVVLPTNPVRFESIEAPEFNPAPLLGEHSKDILEGIGYSSEEITEMINNKVIKAI